MDYLEQKYILLLSPQLTLFKKKSNSLFNFRCPYCGDSQKNKSKARGYIFPKGNSYIYKCHNCSVSTSAIKLIKHVDEKLYNQFVTEKYREDKTHKESPAEKLSTTLKQMFKDSNSKLRSLKKVSQLEDNHPARQFVLKRNIPFNKHYKIFYAPQFYKWVNTVVENKFSSIQKDHPRLIIPFYTKEGDMFAFQGRALNNENPKYITIKVDESKNKIYGLDDIDWSKRVYVVEGPIDSLFLDNCIATAQSDLRVNGDDVVLIPDNEPRNNEVVKQVKTYIEGNFNVVIWPSDIKEKDINEMILSGKTERDIKDIIARNTFNGLLARTKLSEWKRV
tara:strand:- start:588 stop:1589 length:1002 start_codon:yes stop_codon:yes gene_type:complete